MSRNRAYLEHVALRVKDIHWHIRFFREALGMEMREVDGDPESPNQYWTLGGLQFISDPALNPEKSSVWVAGLRMRIAL